MLNIRVSEGGGCANFFCKCSDLPSGQTSQLYNWYQACFTGIEGPGRGVENPPHSSAEVSIEWSYTSSPASVHVIGLPLPLPLYALLKETHLYLYTGI
jgi:hypothetical protein